MPQEANVDTFIYIDVLEHIEDDRSELKFMLDLPA